MVPPLERNAQSTSAMSSAETGRNLVRLNPILAKRCGASRPYGRRSRRNLPSTRTVDFESALLSGIASPNYEFRFSYKITPTRATDSSRAMQRQKYPRFADQQPGLMCLAYGVALVAAAFNAYTDLVLRLASAMLLPGPLLSLIWIYLLFLWGQPSHALVLALRIKFAATSGHECLRASLCLHAVT
jgi:hypothetical protein